MRTLSSILRVAESLDRSHAQAISGLELRDRGDDVLLQVHTATRCRARGVGDEPPPPAVREAARQAGSSRVGDDRPAGGGQRPAARASAA